ncbi:hypothetical protein [Streptomyces sp. NPDC057253]|uniref:hypothetical protein n=1 Tax=Streptomyces sp. NPDC057253 TaxID=3346069 RepID=UPI00363E1F57
MKQDDGLELARARYGLFAVLASNLAIAGVAVVGVWRLDGDKAVIVGVLTAAFTAVSSMTTAYLGIKAVSNTARSIALGEGRERTPAEPTTPAAPASTPAAPAATSPAVAAPAPRTP